MSVKLLTAPHLRFLSLKVGCTGSSENTLIKMPHCWKSRVKAYFKLAHAAKSGRPVTATARTMSPKYRGELAKAVQSTFNSEVYFGNVTFAFFPKLKKVLSGRRYTSREALHSVVIQCLTDIVKSAYRAEHSDSVVDCLSRDRMGRKEANKK